MRTILVLLSFAVCAAQEYRGAIMGRVTDPQDATVPNVKIQATQVETAGKYQTVTSADGQFTLPFLAPGTYRVTVEADGFKRFVRDGLRVGTNERLGVDIRLEVGRVADTVTVTAESPLLVTTTPVASCGPWLVTVIV